MNKLLKNSFHAKRTSRKFKTFGKFTLSFLIALFLLVGLGDRRFGGAVFAQSIKRFEIPVPNENFQVQVIPLKEDGVLLLSKTGRTTFTVTKFDGDLTKSFTLDGQLEENQSYVDFHRDGRDVYLLFAKQNSDLYHVIKVSTGIGVLTKYVFEAISRFEISEFKVHNNIAYLAGMVREEPVLLSIGLNIAKPRIIAGGMKGNASITSIDFDDTEDLLSVTYSVKKGRSSYVVIKKINVNGKIIDQYTIEPDEDFGLLTGKTFTTVDGTELLIGNFGYKGYQSNGVPMSQGLYIGKVGDESTEFLNYHSFTDFKNFFKFMSTRQQEKIEKQIERKKERGGDLKLNYRVLVHDVIKKDNQYILVAEVFYPEFRYNNNNPYGMGSAFGSPFWGRSMMYNPYLMNRYWGLNSWAWNPWLWSNNSFNNQQFDGFKYTHAVVAGFDEKGKLLWDNSFSFDEVKSMDLKEKVKVKVDNDILTLVYSNKGKLNSKIVKGNEVLEGNKSVEISTNREGDKVRDNQNEDIEYWFNNYYLAYGYQKISNRNDGGRRVFYLNKIEF
jgi:hypothetical protein